MKMTDVILKNQLEAILRVYEEDKGLVIRTVVPSNACDPGDNWMSIATMADVEGVKGSGEPYSKSMFIKLLPQDKSRCDLFHIGDAFQNECYVYEEVFKYIPKIGHLVPKFITGGNEILVLENLGALGYKMANKRKGLDLEHAEFVMKAIGEFHASTFHLRSTKGEDVFDKQVSSGLINIKFTTDLFRTFIVKNLQDSLDTLKMARDSGLEPVIKLLEKMIKKGEIVDILIELYHSKGLKVLIHGDLWINNMIFRYIEDSVESVKLLDFQGSCIGSPAVDLWTFFYSSIPIAILNKHYDRLVHIYASSFIKTLEELNMSECKIPEMEDIKEEIDSKEMYGFLISLMYVTVTNMNAEDFSSETLGDLDKILTLENQPNLTIITKFAEIAKRCMSRNVFQDFENRL